MDDDPIILIRGILDELSEINKVLQIIAGVLIFMAGGAAILAARAGLLPWFNSLFGS